MSPKYFATVGVRLIGLLAFVIGAVLVVSYCIMQGCGLGSLTSTSTSDYHLHDTYYVISRVQIAWLIPGVVCIVIGVLLLLCSVRLGAWLARGVES
jgi:hypothetical protein